jgi:hypothetical protein
VLAVKAELVTVREPVTWMAPPFPSVAVLPVNVLPMTVTGLPSSLRIAPPSSLLLPVKVLSMIVRAPLPWS